MHYKSLILSMCCVLVVFHQWNAFIVALCRFMFSPLELERTSVGSTCYSVLIDSCLCHTDFLLVQFISDSQIISWRHLKQADSLTTARHAFLVVGEGGRDAWVGRLLLGWVCLSRPEWPAAAIRRHSSLGFSFFFLKVGHFNWNLLKHSGYFTIKNGLFTVCFHTSILYWMPCSRGLCEHVPVCQWQLWCFLDWLLAVQKI